ncbi:MAG: Fe-S cluster assembly sulfur transfer protein SufU [Ornithinimicrobium sp.]|jgi:nitrogen fixation NifU-like protein|uniref:Fe-S cluster assembly sulfur transfer protein SufU n=1 Tax=Ornithinimicrobium sp. TaxID=1977084 RepID=UPI003D9BA754
MDLYGELLLEHSKRPLHAGLRDDADAEVHHVNPTCGDELTLRVHLDWTAGDDGAVLHDLSYDALGCSISIAATSMLAEEAVGRPVAETLATYAQVHAMLTSKGQDPGDAEQIGDAVALAGVAKYPARVKCALLGWSAYLDALARAGVDIATATAKRETVDQNPTARKVDQ